MTQRNYSAPPIVEAILELRFADELTDADRERVSKKFASRYPSLETGVQQIIGVQVNQNGIALNSTVQERITRRRNLDSPAIVQIGTRIFGVIAPAPYTGWEELFDRFVEDWAAAKKIWKYRPISRIGVRYLNRIDLVPDADGVVEYEDFLNLRINLPENFPSIFNYDLGFQSGIEEIRCGVNVRSGIVEPAVPGRTSFTLDIDVWRQADVPQKDAEVFELLGLMREAKNELFETFITDEARKIFDAG